MEARTAAIVLAAGRGSRMKSKIQKQYLLLKGKPVLYYSLKAFEESFIDEIILVTGEEEIEYCRKEIVEKYGFTKVSHIVMGGKERYHSPDRRVCPGQRLPFYGGVFGEGASHRIYRAEFVHEAVRADGSDG